MAKKKKAPKHPSVRDKIVRLLTATKRKGIPELIEYLINDAFFQSPASRSGHNDFKGGLADHSLNVTELLISFCADLDYGRCVDPGQKPLKLKPENLVIAGIGHDFCKINNFRPNGMGGYTMYVNRDRGHAVLSIKRIRKYIKLEPIEELMIRYHMGVYGLKECDPKTGEYRFRSRGRPGLTKESQEARYGKSLRNAWFHNPVVKLMYFCDEFATITEKFKASVKKRS